MKLNICIFLALTSLTLAKNVDFFDPLHVDTLTKIDALKSVNGGNNCLTCTIIVALVEQLSIVYNQTAERSLQSLCKLLPEGLFRTTCQQAIKQFGSIIINGYA